MVDFNLSNLVLPAACLSVCLSVCLNYSQSIGIAFALYGELMYNQNYYGPLGSAYYENLNILMHPFGGLSLFLDASSHLYKRVCPSVGPSVRPSVRRSVTLL